MGRDYKNEQTLRELYVERGLNVYEVADECDCSASTIQRWLKEFDIERRGHSYDKIPREDLIGELQRLESELEKTPTYWDLDDHSEYSGPTFQNEFGSWNAALVAAGLERNKKALVEFECDNCGECYKKSSHYKDRNERHFCSHECRVDYSSNTVECEWCGGEFEARDFYVNNGWANLCSDSCYREYRSDQYSGENSPLYKGGITQVDYGSPYPKNRKKALERDGHQCRQCGISRKEHRDKHGRDLHVHHRTKISTYKSDGELNKERAHRVENLITLCKDCHDMWEDMPVQPRA